ncbi:MAG: hypothetical protein CL609_16540 [Anaerolineaceae bacterium]|nr:hypothetical protein [Anaerolineaceae bacterium]
MINNKPYYHAEETIETNIKNPRKIMNTKCQPMKPKTIAKIVIDVCMTILLIVLMGRQFWGDVAHEIKTTRQTGGLL